MLDNAAWKIKLTIFPSCTNNIGYIFHNERRCTFLSFLGWLELTITWIKYKNFLVESNFCDKERHKRNKRSVINTRVYESPVPRQITWAYILFSSRYLLHPKCFLISPEHVIKYRFRLEISHSNWKSQMRCLIKVIFEL